MKSCSSATTIVTTTAKEVSIPSPEEELELELDVNVLDIEVHSVINPMLIPHVVKKTLFYSSFADLKSSRLVCKLWKDVGSEDFKSQASIRFYSFQHIDSFLQEQQGQEQASFEDHQVVEDLESSSVQFLEHVQNVHPPSNISLGSGSLCRNVCLHGKDFQEWVVLLKPFFSQYGSYIKSLDISHGIGDVTEEFLLQISQHVDYLEELSISGCTVLYSDRYSIDGVGGGGTGGFQFYPILPSVKRLSLALPVTCFKRWLDVRRFFTDFLSLFPNVQSIKFIGCQFPELFKYLPQEIRFPYLSSIHLQLLSSEGLHHFMRRDFNLRKIILEIEPLLGLTNLHGFIESFAHSLVDLELRFHFKGVYNYSHNATAFPSSVVLTKLKYLKLYGYWGNLYFLKDFKSLRLAIVERMQWGIAFPEGINQARLCPNGAVLKFYDERGIYYELL